MREEPLLRNSAIWPKRVPKKHVIGLSDPAEEGGNWWECVRGAHVRRVMVVPNSAALFSLILTFKMISSLCSKKQDKPTDEHERAFSIKTCGAELLQ